MNTNPLIPLAAEMVGVVHDFGPDAVASVLASIPDGSRDDLIVLLARMVDPDKSTAELLAWMDTPVQSRTFEPASLRPDLRHIPCPDCGKQYRASSLARHRRIHDDVKAA